MTPDFDRIETQLPGERLEARRIELRSGGRVAASAYDVDHLLGTSAAFTVGAADDVGRRRGVEPPARTLDLDHVVAFCTTYCTVDGDAVPAWADLSGVYPTGDGRHLQLHCNFPHHAEGVARRLGVEQDRDAVAAAVADRRALDLERQLVDDGMIAALVRTLEEWDAHPHAAATHELPLVGVERIGDAPPAASGGAITRALEGVCVLDCSRVLAGPVAGQMLAAFGADVLRLGAEHLPSVPVGVISTGFGKRNAFADLRTGAGRAAMSDLLAGADVWIDAYRPGALAGHGFDAGHAAALRPGIVIVQISAFDWIGPWAGRRGFDSIVQSTTGVRWAGGVHAAGDDTTPRGLPVQALDYATGFLAAGVAARLLMHQREVGGSWLARLSLLRTRNWLIGLGGPTEYEPRPVAVRDELLHTVDSDFGRVTTVGPFAGHWDRPPSRLGSSRPAWSS